jgi:hypothetical protein
MIPTRWASFLRGQLQEFLRAQNAAAIIIHHLPKAPKSGRGRAADTQYAGHGSAEWANAPRASITIERTRAPYVFEFGIGKGGPESGWEVNRQGQYVRYFVHSRSKDLFWDTASENDVAEASGIATGPPPQVKATKTAAKQSSFETQLEEVFRVIDESRGTGIIVTDIRKKVSSSISSAATIADCLKELQAKGRVDVLNEGSRTRRYFPASPSVHSEFPPEVVAEATILPPSDVTPGKMTREQANRALEQLIEDTGVSMDTFRETLRCKVCHHPILAFDEVLDMLAGAKDIDEFNNIIDATIKKDPEPTDCKYHPDNTDSWIGR